VSTARIVAEDRSGLRCAFDIGGDHMTDPRSLPDDRLDIGTEPLEDELLALEGEAPLEDQDAVVDPDEIEDEEEDLDANLDYEEGVPRDPSLRRGETDDVLVAIEEGETWVPPTDPPVVPAPGDPDQIEVPGSEDQDAGEGDLNARIREALRSDSATSPLADRIEIAVIGSTAILRGEVDGPEDSDALVQVASGVEGIDDVDDETVYPGL
jgi:hypothetical protein